MDQGTRRPTHIAKLGKDLASFRLNNLYITDNRLLFVAPGQDFCRTCFRRRYYSQTDGSALARIRDSALQLAMSIDHQSSDGRLWKWFQIDGRKAGKAFVLSPFEDCPVCGGSLDSSRDNAKVRYENLLDRVSSPRLDALKDQVFSFGFARGAVSDNKIGMMHPALSSLQPKLDRILGENHNARIFFRMVTQDGRSVNDTSTGFAQDQSLAELKAVMEYLERYAFMLQTCQLGTSEYDEGIIGKYLELFNRDFTGREQDYLRSRAFWAINLRTGELAPIPSAFVDSEGKLDSIHPTSNGFAAHVDFRKSMCGCILELVERDAFMRFWYDPERAFGFEPSAGAQADIGRMVSVLQEVLANDRLASRCFIVQSPTRLPVVMVVICSQDFSLPPSLCAGYGAGFSVEEALAGAVRELRINVGNLVKAVAVYDDYLEWKPDSPIESAQDRMHLYSTSAPREKLKFLDRDNPVMKGVVEEVEAHSLEVLVNRFAQVGFDLFGLDFTPACFQDKGVFVTRAFSPQLIPLQTCDEDTFRLPTGRLSARLALPHFFI